MKLENFSLGFEGLHSLEKISFCATETGQYFKKLANKYFAKLLLKIRIHCREKLRNYFIFLVIFSSNVHIQRKCIT